MIIYNVYKMQVDKDTFILKDVDTQREYRFVDVDNGAQRWIDAITALN